MNEKDVKGSGRGLILENIPARIIGLWVGIRNRGLSNKVKEVKLFLCGL
jgi:hypothetical protein